MHVCTIKYNLPKKYKAVYVVFVLRYFKYVAVAAQLLKIVPHGLYSA